MSLHSGQVRWSMSALVMATIGCATGPFDSVASRFKYRIPFDVNSVQSPGADRVEVSELWGTRSKIEVGGDYLVVGTYSLQSLKQGRVCFYLTADGWDNSGSDTDLLRIDAAQGQGSFALVHSMPGPGDLHVSLSGWRDGDSIRVANVYLKNHEPRAGESAPNGRAP